MSRHPASDSDLLIFVLPKGVEKYIFIFSDDRQGECIRRASAHAANPELSFDWSDVKDLADAIRNST